MFKIVPKIPAIRLVNGKTITHESETIGAPVLVVEVFCAEALQHFLVVQDTPGIHGRDPPLVFAVFVPGPTATRPHGPFEEFLTVRIILHDDVWLDEDGSKSDHRLAGDVERCDGKESHLMSWVAIFLHQLRM